MKNITLFSLILITLFTGCATTEKEEHTDSELHSKLVGTWEGHTIRQDGNKKEWVQVRYPDGRYEITFKYYDGLSVSTVTKEEGKWWVKDGRFNEQWLTKGSQPFVYEVEWLDQNCIEMKSIKRDPNGDEYEGYTFSECRKMM